MSPDTMSSHALVIHLCGRQTLPIYLIAKATRAKYRLLLCSEETSSIANHILQNIDEEYGSTMQISPYDIVKTQRNIMDTVSGIGASAICCDITGGTKLMAVALLQLSIQNNWACVYLDSTHRELIWLSQNGKRTPYPTTISSITPFIRLTGECIVERHTHQELLNKLPQRKHLTHHLFLNSALANRITQKALKVDDRNHFKISNNRFFAKVSLARAEITIDGIAYELENTTDVYHYLTGGWLEEYCAMQLLAAHEKRLIYDLSMNVKTSAHQQPQSQYPSKKNIFQEMDICFTDGYQLYLLEVKSGAVTQEQIQKLENLTQRYGGAMGRAFIVSNFQLWTTSKAHQRIQRSSVLTGIHGSALKNLYHHISNSRPGEVINR